MVSGSRELAEGSAKAVPPVLVSATSFVGVPLEQWVYIITIVYVLLQIAFLCYKWWCMRRDRRAKEAEDRDAGSCHDDEED